MQMSLTMFNFRFFGLLIACLSLLGLFYTKNLSVSLDTSMGMTLAKLDTHFYPPTSTSSPSIYSLLMPADGDVADDIMTLLIPVM